jgi:ATP-dependent Lhr-like helicase
VCTTTLELGIDVGAIQSRRWVVVFVDEQAKVVDLKPAAGGKPPPFSPRETAPVHDRVRQEMLRLYQDTALPRYLDSTAHARC